ncbi:MAG: alanine dehydrogenase [Pseudomonadota bacterium]
MIVGLVKEIKIQEYRVALTPEAVKKITRLADKVLVEQHAGLGSGFSDQDYIDAGAIIVLSATEIWQQADLVIKVKEPQQAEFSLMKENLILFSYFHFASSLPLLEACLKQKITALAYETLEDDKGQLPLLKPMSAIAGKMAAHQGAKYLEKTYGGKGILMGGLELQNTHVEAANVIVLGGGVVGFHAAKVASGMGAKVTLFELNPVQVKKLQEVFGHRVMVLQSDPNILAKLLATVDVIIGAVLIAGAKAPKLISQSDLSLMQPGTVLVDVAIDQGGCFESSHATTHDDPVYIEQGIVHYCVTNLPGAVSRSGSQALSGATLSYILQLLELGLDKFLAQSPGHRLSLNLRSGQIQHPVLRKEFSQLL